MRAIATLALFVLCISFVNATVHTLPNLEVELDVQDVQLGEPIGFGYTMTSDGELPLLYYAHVDCPSASMAPIEYQTVLLYPDEPFQGEFNLFAVTSDTESQTCTAVIHITEPLERRLTKEFEIITKAEPKALGAGVTDGAITFKKVYKQGEVLRFNTKDQDITGNILLPDGRTETISEGILLDQVGQYTLSYEIAETEITKHKKGMIRFSAIREPITPTKKEFIKELEIQQYEDNEPENIVGQSYKKIKPSKSKTLFSRFIDKIIYYLLKY